MTPGDRGDIADRQAPCGRYGPRPHHVRPARTVRVRRLVLPHIHLQFGQRPGYSSPECYIALLVSAPTRGLLMPCRLARRCLLVASVAVRRWWCNAIVDVRTRSPSRTVEPCVIPAPTVQPGWSVAPLGFGHSGQCPLALLCPDVAGTAGMGMGRCKACPGPCAGPASCACGCSFRCHRPEVAPTYRPGKSTTIFTSDGRPGDGGG